MLNDCNEKDLKRNTSRINKPNNKKCLSSKIDENNISVKKIVININTPDIWC